jgi:hypothetical protein
VRTFEESVTLATVISPTRPLRPVAWVLTLTVAVRGGRRVGLLYRCELSEETEHKVEPYLEAK